MKQMQALITGATSGIGMAIAKELSKRGWSLILTGRNQEKLLELKETLPVPVEIFPLDLSKENAPFQLYDFCKGKQVDLLVNNAGFGVFGKFTETDLQEELELLSLNVRAHPQCCIQRRFSYRSPALFLLRIEKLCGSSHTGHCGRTAP